MINELKMKYSNYDKSDYDGDERPNLLAIENIVLGMRFPHYLVLDCIEYGETFSILHLKLNLIAYNNGIIYVRRLSERNQQTNSLN